MTEPTRAEQRQDDAAVVRQVTVKVGELVCGTCLRSIDSSEAEAHLRGDCFGHSERSVSGEAETSDDDALGPHSEGDA